MVDEALNIKLISRKMNTKDKDYLVSCLKGNFQTTFNEDSSEKEEEEEVFRRERIMKSVLLMKKIANDEQKVDIYDWELRDRIIDMCRVMLDFCSGSDNIKGFNKYDIEQIKNELSIFCSLSISNDTETDKKKVDLLYILCRKIISNVFP